MAGFPRWINPEKDYETATAVVARSLGLKPTSSLRAEVGAKQAAHAEQSKRGGASFRRIDANA